MAIPLPVTPAPVEEPAARPIELTVNVGFLVGEVDNYLSGDVVGPRLELVDLNSFAWWVPEGQELPY